MPPIIHKILGNNIIIVIANGYRASQEDQQRHYLANLAMTLAYQLHCYAVISTKYKKEIMDYSSRLLLIE